MDQPLTETELLLLLQRDQFAEGAMRALFMLFSRRFDAAARLAGAHDANGVRQEAFFSLFDHRHEFDPAESTASKWLWKHFREALRLDVRTARRVRDEVPLPDADDYVDPKVMQALLERSPELEGIVEHELQRQALDLARERLTDDERRALLSPRQGQAYRIALSRLIPAARDSYKSLFRTDERGGGS
jgi:DNA-directed RNA polymerase specialized sigma24 family protein